MQFFATNKSSHEIYLPNFSDSSIFLPTLNEREKVLLILAGEGWTLCRSLIALPVT